MKITDQEIEKMLEGMELEEPSMSFTRNVMEQVKLEIAPVSLKTKVDKRIIYTITGVFIFSIVLILAYAISNSEFTYSMSGLEINLNAFAERILTSSLLNAFLMIDLVIALIYFDRLLRRRRA